MTIGTMEKDKPIIRRPDVLKKFSAEGIQMIERGLLNELPDKLKPQQFIPRAAAYLEPKSNTTSKHSAVQKYEKQSMFISCLSPRRDTVEDTPVSDDDRLSPLKKTVSFREKMSLTNLFSKDKEKLKSAPKVETIVEEDKIKAANLEKASTMDRDSKMKKRFWFFRHKDISDSKEKRLPNRPVYVRSKSFESMPRLSVEDYDRVEPSQTLPRVGQSFVYGSTDVLSKYTDHDFDDDDGVFLKPIKESASLQSSYTNSSVSTGTSRSSGINMNILQSESVANIFKEFDRTVEMFSENYLSDSEPYTKWQKEWSLQDKRKSLSHSEIPSPKIVQIKKVNDLSGDFKRELTSRLNCRSDSGIGCRMARRGSVTDWFVLEESGKAVVAAPSDRYRRAQKKPINRVRRISSTKYLNQHLM
ncbi:uncharacterized protein LOC131843565 [Achroia grisella]|uniref:uncharacterized protein LOC131843565 n=1 Tax=Achroia grisella TaxID=688607 RepID=UPI0027D3095E|nr:uncharacterized protein LOC131843565 [Achroia grisella]